MNIMKLADGSVIQKLNDAIFKKSGQKMIVYQEMQPPYTIYVVEENDFYQLLSASVMTANAAEVSRVPDAVSAAATATAAIEEEATMNEEDSSIMLQFLDAESYKEKIKVLEKNKSLIDTDMLELMAAALDEYLEGTDREELYYSFMQILRMRARFETDRR